MEPQPTKVVKPVRRVKCSKAELARRKAARNVAYYDIHFERLRAKAMDNYNKKKAERAALKEAEAAAEAEVGVDKVETKNVA